MANHIQSIATSGVPQVTEQEFLDQCKNGDLVFCQGNYMISKIIEHVTKSCLSHVLMVWKPEWSVEWLTLEATIEKGVHVGRLEYYTQNYDGSLILTTRNLNDQDIIASLQEGASLLEDSYDWIQELTMPGHNLLKVLPVANPKHEYFCSGLQYQISLKTSEPLSRPDPKEFPTPEDNFTSSSVVPKVCLLRVNNEAIS